MCFNAFNDYTVISLNMVYNLQKVVQIRQHIVDCGHEHNYLVGI